MGVMVFGRWRHSQRRAATAPVSPNPFDHDRDGRPGGSLPATKRGLAALWKRAEALGIKRDRRWGAARLLREIAAATRSSKE